MTAGAGDDEYVPDRVHVAQSRVENEKHDAGRIGESAGNEQCDAGVDRAAVARRADQKNGHGDRDSMQRDAVDQAVGDLLAESLRVRLSDRRGAAGVAKGFYRGKDVIFAEMRRSSGTSPAAASCLLN